MFTTDRISSQNFTRHIQHQCVHSVMHTHIIRIISLPATHTHDTNTYISLGGPGVGGGAPFPLVCSSEGGGVDRP